MTTVIEMIAKYLLDTGADGLVKDDGECHCTLSDLAPCGAIGIYCEAARKLPCSCGFDCDFDLVAIEIPSEEI